MSKVECEVKVIEVDYICDECNEGVLRMDLKSGVLMTYPPQYRYVCTKCSYKTILTEEYPRLRYVKRKKK